MIAEPEEAAPEAQPDAAQAKPVVTGQVVDGVAFELRWEPDTPLPAAQARPARADSSLALSAEDWWTPSRSEETLRSEPIRVEAPTAPANLIEFPRELVATRKMRPRLAEVPAPAPAGRQLSIFEVIPGAVSTEPAPAVESTSRRTRAEWSGIELDELPFDAEEPQPEPASALPAIHLAPLGRRMMALTVDGLLILAAFFGAALDYSSNILHLPSAKGAELMAVAGIAVAGLLYHALFCALRASTPGMRYAGIALSTFDDQRPTRAQLWRRLGFLGLSLLPVGLGVAWSLFDDDRLCWHDRISQTYLRKR
jgi:uncharacterized RDD family membrane protein YckC